jgi:hypothetical protein
LETRALYRSQSDEDHLLGKKPDSVKSGGKQGNFKISGLLLFIVLKALQQILKPKWRIMWFYSIALFGNHESFFEQHLRGVSRTVQSTACQNDQSVFTNYHISQGSLQKNEHKFE